MTAILLLILTGAAVAQETADPPEEAARPVPARIMPRALRATMLDIAARDELALAVGERGIILRSEDSGQTWKQVPCPVDVTLTGISFASDGLVWAVGHESTILLSEDAGQNWAIVRFEGVAGNYYLDVRFLDTERGHVLAANGELWQTTDGGATWNVAILAADEFVQNHLFGLAINGAGSSLVAAEKGALFIRRSPDDATWEVLESPYNGSFFGVLPLGERFLIFGMSGRAFIGPDDQGNYQEIRTGTDQFLLAGTLLPDGSALVGGRGGVLLRIDSTGEVVDRQILRGRADILALERQGERAFIATSRGGIEDVAVRELFAKEDRLATLRRYY